jgi:hypothetical protein
MFFRPHWSFKYGDFAAKMRMAPSNDQIVPAVVSACGIHRHPQILIDAVAVWGIITRPGKGTKN